MNRRSSLELIEDRLRTRMTHYQGKNFTGERTRNPLLVSTATPGSGKTRLLNHLLVATEDVAEGFVDPTKEYFKEHLRIFTTLNSWTPFNARHESDVELSLTSRFYYLYSQYS